MKTRLFQPLQLVAAAFALLAVAAWSPSARAESPTLDPQDRVLGDANAPVTVIEYASLTCPHCAAFQEDTFPQVKKDWIDTGKVKWVFRDYPLDDSAVVAATVARCLPPERFFPFVDTLFKSQRQWVYRDSKDSKAAVGKMVRIAGMSEEQFDQCTSNQKNSDAVVASRLVAQNKYDVNSTPTFFINGRKILGDLPYSEFSKYLGSKSSDAAPATSGATSTATNSTAAAPGLIQKIKSWFGS